MGIPTVTVCSTAFAGAARRQAAGRGMDDLPVVEIPHPMHSATQQAVTERAEAAVLSLAAALTERVASVAGEAATCLPDTMALNVDPVALEEFFFEQGWTDGLPITPATRAAVDAMLAAVGRDPQAKKTGDRGLSATEITRSCRAGG